jgi:hypothetical protein
MKLAVVLLTQNMWHSRELSSRYRWGRFSSGMLGGIDWELVTDVLGQHFIPGEEHPVPIEQRTVLAPEPVWAIWIRDKFVFVLGWEPRFVLTACRSLVAIPTELACPNPFLQYSNMSLELVYSFRAYGDIVNTARCTGSDCRVFGDLGSYLHFIKPTVPCEQKPMCSS